MNNLSLAQFDSYVDRLKTIAFTTISALKQLDQINQLITEKNRILLQNPVLFRTLQRTISQSSIINVAMFTDPTNDAFNLRTLAKYLEQYKRKFINNDASKLADVEEILTKIKNLDTNETRRKIKNMRDKIYGHVNKELIEQKERYEEFIAKNDISWQEVGGYLETIGEILNEITGLLLDKGTVMGIVGDDMTYAQFKGLEEAILLEDWLGIKAPPGLEQEAREYVKNRLTKK